MYCCYCHLLQSIRELIPWYHEEPIDTEIAGCLRVFKRILVYKQTAISERYTGVYQVAVSFNEPLEYHLDPNAVDVFYAQAGLYFILVWKMVVSADMLKVPNRRKWYEKTIITVIWVTVLFALIFLVGNVYMKIGDIDSQYVCHNVFKLDVKLENAIEKHSKFFLEQEKM